MGNVMKINEIMTSQPHIIDENASIFELAQKMQLVGCGIFPVGNLDRIEGVVTDRDIINRAVSQKLDLNNTKVKDIMSKSVIFCYEDENITRAINLMNKHRIRRILIINDDYKLVGILSMIDIFKRLKDKSILSNLFINTLYA